MKKIVAAVLLCAIYAFAAWDYFPVLEAGKGQAKITYSAGKKPLLGKDLPDLQEAPPNERGYYDEGVSFKGIRYVPFANLELMTNGPAFGFRYQALPVFSVFLDVKSPFAFAGSDIWIIESLWEFHPGLQFSTAFSERFSLGSQLGVTFDNWKDNKGVSIDVDAELDIALGKGTFWFGIDGDIPTDGNKGMTPNIGYVVGSDVVSIEASIGWAMYQHTEIDTKVTVGATVGF